MRKQTKVIPKFKDEEEEREFWATHSPLEYFNINDIKKAAFPNLRPSLKSISIRLPEAMLNELKNLARQIAEERKDLPRALSKGKDKAEARG